MNRTSWRRIRLVSLLAAALAASIPAATWAQSDLPRLMIVADTSAAMDEAVYHFDYDPHWILPGYFDRNANYRIARTGPYSPHDFDPRWPPTPAVTLVTSINGRSSFYSGNYLNWVFFHADIAQRASIPQLTRITGLQWLLNRIILDATDVELALTIFDGDNGGRIVSRFGAPRAALLQDVEHLRSDASAPFAETMEEILDYFAEPGPSGAIDEGGRSHFCLVIGGGVPTGDLDVSTYLQDADGDGDDPGSCTTLGAPYPDSDDCSAYFDDVTWYMAHRDLRPDLAGLQLVSTYVLGLGFDHPLMSAAATNGQGMYFAGEVIGNSSYLAKLMIADMVRRSSRPTSVPGLSGSALLLQCQPNPFNPRTTIRFDLPEPGPVRLSVFDLAGHLIRVLVDGHLPPGSHEAIWDGKDASGRDAPSGSYVARLESNGKLDATTMALVR